MYADLSQKLVSYSVHRPCETLKPLRYGACVYSPNANLDSKRGQSGGKLWLLTKARGLSAGPLFSTRRGRHGLSQGTGRAVGMDLRCVWMIVQSEDEHSCAGKRSRKAMLVQDRD